MPDLKYRESVSCSKDRIGRILIVTSNFPRWQGDATTPFVLTLAKDLGELGWEVDVLAPHAPGAALHETLDGVRVERFRYFWPARWQTVCYQGGAMVNLRKRPLEKIKLPLFVLSELMAITWRLLFRRYDVVHSHWILPQGFTGMIACKIARVPHVVTVHGGDIFSLRGKLMSSAKKVAILGSSAVTVNSNATKNETMAVCPDISDLRLIPMGVNVNPLNEQERDLAEQVRARYVNDDGPLLIFVGRLVEEKGGGDAVRAVRLIKQYFPNVRLLILGEGQDGAALQKLVAKMGLVNEVLFLGWVDSSKVRAYLSSADIFLGPSRTAPDGAVEAQGLTFLEAMAVGTPVIATRLGGIVDSVIDGQTGLLVEERSPEQIAKAVIRLVKDAGIRNRLAENARKNVIERFSRETSAKSFSELFSTLINRGDSL